ncbi:hypothetical protein Tco_1471609, partial [Tanacetum coccineum]
MYGLCLPCGKCARLQQRLLLQMLHDVVKAATRLVGSYEGCHIGYCEGCHIIVKLMQRLPYRLQQSLLAHAEAAIKVVGCCEGYNRACWLLRRLPYRLPANAVVKAAIKVASFYKGCHIGFYKGCHIAEKAVTLLKRIYRGYGLDILLKTNPVGIKSLLDAVRITVAQVYINTALM